MGKIKILYIMRGGDLYGDNRSMLQTILSLQEHVQPFVCVQKSGLVGEELRKYNIPYKIIANTMSPVSGECNFFYRASRFPFYVIKSVMTYFQLLQVASNFKPDIVSSNNSFIYAGIYLAKRMNIPHVWHLREYVDKDHNKQLPRRMFFDKSIKKSHCIAVSKGVFEYRKLSVGKDTYIYNGVFSQNDIPPYYSFKEDYFLFLGRITVTKGVTEMILSFIDFCKKNKTTKLLVVGEGTPNYIKELNTMLYDANIEHRVQFLSFCKDIRPLLIKAKALIVPSLFEAYGRITPEALLCGCFVIGRNTAGTKEILENVNAGILYNSKEELTSAMACIAQMSNERLEYLNQKAQKESVKLYTCEKNASDMIKFYQDILSIELNKRSK